MNEHEPDRDPVEALADDFLARVRRGETADVDEYAARHPELAEQIRALFPTMLAMEKLKQARAPLQPSAKIVGRPTRLGDFRIIREIGRGGMGIVYEAEQESLGRHVAVKVLPRGPFLNDKQLQRFEREASTAARLHHTNIVPVFGVGEQDGVHYYVMQYIRGVGLDRVLEELQKQLDRGGHDERPTGSSTDTAGASAGTFDVILAVQALRSGSFPKAVAWQPSSSPGASGPRQSNGTNASASTSPEATQVLLEESTATDSEPREIAADDLDLARLSDRYWRSVARLGVQVADALQYAHSQGVLHRDIKPGNLLLDARGTVWIADFGLAKALEQPGVTDSGDLLGTLLYMAPEQFEGKFDQQSDIYSLGVTLYEMLTLQPLFASSSRHQLIQQITQEEPRRPRALAPHLPRDLETIVLKATTRDPGRRYASAGALAADLQNFLEDRPIQARRVTAGERFWRWCRRNKALAALGGIVLTLLAALAITGTVGYVSTRAALEREEKQRLRAENTSALAEEALEKIFRQLAPQRLLASAELTLESQDGQDLEMPLQLPISRDTAELLEQLLVYYDRLADQGGNDSKLRRPQAHASRRVGDIQFRLGQLDQARKAYERAAAIYQDLRLQNPQDQAALVDCARVYNALGKVHGKRRDHEQARQAFHTAIDILDEASHADAEQVQYELAANYYQLGKPGPSGRKRAPDRKPSTTAKDKTENAEYLNKAITLLERLVRDHPAAPAYRHLLALCYRALARGQLVSQRDPKPRDDAIQILRDLVNEHPDVPDYRFDLSETLGQADIPYWFLPKTDTARYREQFAEALELARELVNEYPNIVDYKMLKNVMHYNLGHMQERGGALAEAEDNFRLGLKQQEALARSDPQAPLHQLWKTKFEIALAGVLRAEKKLEGAKLLLEGAIDRIEPMLAKQPDSPYVRFMLGALYTRLAECLRDLGLEADAVNAEERAKLYRRPTMKE